MSDVKKLAREVRLLKWYAAVSMPLLAMFTLSAFRSERRERIAEIDVERINVVEPDGRLRLVIANSARMPGAVIRGEELMDHREGKGIAGMLFYNAEGTKAGGLTTVSRRNEDGSYTASEHLSFDRYNQDQVLTMTYRGRDGHQSAAFQVWDRPGSVDIDELIRAVQAKEGGSSADQAKAEQVFQQAKEETAERIWMGSEQRTASIRLHDTEGRVRIRMVVDSADVSRLEFLDDDGEVVLRLPEERP